MKKTYHIITIGCQMNISDSERLASFLESEGFKYCASRDKASLLIFNTCGVKQMAEDRVYGLINEIKKENSDVRIMITGCLSKREDVMKRLIGLVDWFVPVGEMNLIPSLWEGGDYRPKYSLDEYRLAKGEKYLTVLPKYESNYSANVPIGNGCNNFCSYCVVPYARGREVYRPAKDIINEVKDLVRGGYKEIILVAQNVNSYRDDKYKFPELLTELVKIPGKFWLRFSSSHPKDMSDELISVIGSSDKIAAHLHLAMQSGDDNILKAMNRKYTYSHFKKLIGKVRTSRTGIAITTDAIVGFPGESKKQFENTVKAFKEIGFEMAYISQYSPRPGTVSAKINDNVSKAEKKERFKILNEILKSSALSAHKSYEGQTLEVLVDGQNKQGKYFGKSSAYKTVQIDTKGKKLAVGSFAKVLITKALPFGLNGELLVDKPKVLVVLGPTASGKTGLGVRLAADFNGEIISADSRQVFRGMDIGTGKDLKDYKVDGKKIKHHLIDIIDPQDDFDLAKYQKAVFVAIDDILKRKKLPIIVGGSGLYLQAVIDNYELGSSRPDMKRRIEIEKLSAREILDKIAALKPDFAAKLNNSDRNNPRRLARYLEIVENGELIGGRKESPYEFLVLGLDFPDAVLRERIEYRLLSRFEEGMIAEVKRLLDEGVPSSRLKNFGLEYRFITEYLEGDYTYNELVKKLEIAIYRFAKRQKNWFRRWEKQGREIFWLKKKQEADKLIKHFLAK